MDSELHRRIIPLQFRLKNKSYPYALLNCKLIFTNITIYVTESKNSIPQIIVNI